MGIDESPFFSNFPVAAFDHSHRSCFPYGKNKGATSSRHPRLANGDQRGNTEFESYTSAKKSDRQVANKTTQASQNGKSEGFQEHLAQDG